MDRCRVFSLALGLVVSSIGLATAQGTYSLSISDATATRGIPYQQDVRLDVTNDMTVEGWEFAICHFANQKSLCGVALPQFVRDLNPSGLDFAAVTISDQVAPAPNPQGGLTCAVVIDSTATFTFPNNSEHAILELYYVSNPTVFPTVSNNWFCSVGQPAVDPVIHCCGNTAVPVGPNLSTVDGSVTYAANFAMQFVAEADDHTVLYDATTGGCLSGCTWSLRVHIGPTITSTPTLSTGAGLRLELGHDSQLLTFLGASPGAGLMALNGGNGPEGFTVSVNGDHISVLVENNLPPADPLLPYAPELTTWVGQEAVVLDFAATTGSLAGSIGDSANFLYFPPPGEPRTAVLLPCGGAGLVPVRALDTLHSTVWFAATGPDHVRGDCNDDGSVNITDAVFMLISLTSPVSTVCRDACDANDDSAFNIADPVRLLDYLFQSGSPPPAPFPNCGADLSGDILGCASFSGCP